MYMLYRDAIMLSNHMCLVYTLDLSFSYLVFRFPLAANLIETTQMQLGRRFYEIHWLFLYLKEINRSFSRELNELSFPSVRVVCTFSIGNERDKTYEKRHSLVISIEA